MCAAIHGSEISVNTICKYGKLLLIDIDVANITTIEIDQDCVWPGDTDTSNVVDNFDLLNKKINVEVSVGVFCRPIPYHSYRGTQ